MCTRLARPLIPLCCPYASFLVFARLILTKGHNTLFNAYRFPPFQLHPRARTCTFVSLSPQPLCGFLYILWAISHPLPVCSLLLSHSFDNFIAPSSASPSFSFSPLFQEKKGALEHIHTPSFVFTRIHTPPRSLSVSSHSHSLYYIRALQGNELVIFMMKPSPNYSFYRSFSLCLFSPVHKMTLILSALPM